VEKTNELYVLVLVKCYFAIVNFDLWMSKGAYDVLSLVIAKHVTIGLFETTKTIRQALAKSLTKLLDKYGFFLKMIVYVKDEGLKFNIMIGALKFVVNCEYFRTKESFQGTCLDMHFQKHVNMAM